jgi:hypothetical protein
MKAESLDTSYLARPDGAGPFPGLVVVHEASGLNDNIRDICGRFAREGYAALGVDLFAGRNRAAYMARMFARLRIYWRYSHCWQAGPLGSMYRPSYLHRGYAVHGIISVPAYPGSHGCVRMTSRRWTASGPRCGWACR